MFMLQDVHASRCFIHDLQIQLVRIELRIPEYGWTTQKVFHLMIFTVNGGNIYVTDVKTPG